MIPFGEWLPDLPDHLNPGANHVMNVVPGHESYHPVYGLNAYSNDTGLIYGMSAFTNSGGTHYNFSGSDDELRLLRFSPNNDWSTVGTGYSLPANTLWNFTQYGDDAIACQVGDYPQKYTMGVDSAFSNLTTAFKAAHCAVIGNFLIFGNTSDTTDGDVPNRVRWSAFDDITQYTVSPVTQSDYQDMSARDGAVVGLVGGTYGIVFQERAISRLTYAGSPVVFQVDKVESRGTKYQNSIINAGGMIAYLSDDGFYVFDGERSVGIGNGKVDRTFFNDLNQNYRHMVIGTHDPFNHLFIWGYVSRTSDTSDDVLIDRLIMFNYSQNAKYRWSQTEISTHMIGRSRIPDVVVSKEYIYWSSNDEYLTCMTPSVSGDVLNVFTGEPLDAVLETAEVEVIPGKRSSLSRLRPHILLNTGATLNTLWSQRTPAESNTYRSVTVGSSTLQELVAVSSDGTNRVMSTNDGITWIARTAAAATSWASVCWAPSPVSLYCAVALSGQVMTASSSNSWTSRTAAEANSWTSVCWSPDLTLFVAVSSTGTNRVMTSPDGINWTARSATSSAWQSVCWSPDLGLFVAVANSGSNRVMTSTDGTTWTARDAAEASAWVSVCWSPDLGLFCAVATSGTHVVMTSDDGITWTAQTAVGGDWNSVCWSDDLGVFVAVSGTASTTSPDDVVMISEDGEYWTGVDAIPRYWRSVTWFSYLSRFIAVGNESAMTSQAESPGEVTLQVGERNTNSSLVTWSDEISGETDGNYAVRSNARFHRFRANITGSFDNAQGIEIQEARQSGNR